MFFQCLTVDSRNPWTEWLLRRSEEHTSELQSPCNLVCRLLREKKRPKLQNRGRCAGSIRCAEVAGRLRDDVEEAAHACRSSCHGRLCCRYRFVAGGPQAIDFLRGQGAESPGFDVEGERPVANALDLLHMVSDLLKHAPDLAVAAFD